MLMVTDLVRPQVAHHLAAHEVFLGRPTGAGGATGRDDDDVVALDQAGIDERRQPQDRRRRIAAGSGHSRRRGDLLPGAGQLGSPYGQLPAYSPP